MRFNVTVELESDDEFTDEIVQAAHDWLEKLVKDRMNGLARASKAIMKKGHKCKVVVQEIRVERAGEQNAETDG